MEFLRENPAFTLSEISRHIRIPHSTTSYHVQKLLRTGDLQEVTEGGRRRYLLRRNPLGPQEIRALVVLSSRGAWRLLNEAWEMGCSSRTDLARRMGVGLSTIEWHSTRLAKAGLLSFVGRRRRIEVNRKALEETIGALSRKLPSFRPLRPGLFQGPYPQNEAR